MQFSCIPAFIPPPIVFGIMNRFLISEIAPDKDEASDTGFLLEARSTTRITRTPSVSNSPPALIHSTVPSPIGEPKQSPPQQDTQQQPEAEAAAPRVPSQSLGQAFLVIFQATRSTLRKALLTLDSDNVLSKSLRTLVDYVLFAEQDASLAKTRSIEVLRPFLDKIMKKSDENAKKISFLLLDWQLLDHPCRSIIAQALALEMGPKTEDKKRKLSALLALDHALSTRYKRILEKNKQETNINQSIETKSTPKETVEDKNKIATNFLDVPEVKSHREGGGRGVIEVIEPTEYQIAATNEQESKTGLATGEELCAPFEGPTLVEMISHLSYITRHDGASASDGVPSMTRLTGLAFQLSISLSRMLTKSALREIELEEEEENRVKKSGTPATKPKRGPLIVELDSESERTLSQVDKDKQADQLSLRWSFAKSMGSIRGVIEDLKSWSRNKSLLMTAALEDTLDMLSRFCRHYQRQLEEADSNAPKLTVIESSSQGPPPPPFREVVKSFAKCWKPVSAALCPIEESIPSSPETLRKRVRETLDQKELPPFVRLHVIGLLLGQAEPTVSADALKPTATDDKLRTEILEMADLVIKSGIPVARNVAVEVDKQLKTKEPQRGGSKPVPGSRSASLPLTTSPLTHLHHKDRPAPTIAMVD